MRYLIVIVVFVVAACDSKKDRSVAFEEEPFEQDTVFVDNFFPAFKSDDVPQVLERLGLCTTVDSLAGISKSLCSPELFRAFALGPDIPFEKGFIVDTKIGVLSESATTKAFLVFYNIDGKMEMVNFLKGKVLEFRTTPGGFFDLVMKYRNTQVGGYISVVHTWNEERQTYLPEEVYEINDHFVLETYKDSINHVYLDEFAWGY